MGDAELAPASHDVPASLPSLSSSSREPRWRPSGPVFRRYSQNAPQGLHVVVRQPLVARLTRDIVETYQICNPQFRYSEELNPKRYLTSPSIGVLNDGCDNANSDLILSVNYALVNLETQRRYVVKDVLGHGTFGQVAKCWVAEANSFVAVKIIKNQPAYYQQALVEVSILRTLNIKYDPEDRHHIVRIYDYFVHQRHLCIAFELLDTNLYEVIKMNNFRGLSLSYVQLFSKQILHGLILMKDAGIIHCDLKPENILLCARKKPAILKIIDFGSACVEDRTVYSYIQSRYYRSPEVVLGYQYTTAIDMWSLGCIVAELFLGLPLFPGASEFDLLRRMIEIIGGQPPDHILKEAKNTTKYFKCIGSVHFVENGGVSTSGRSAFQALTEDEYEARELKKPTIGKEYFNHMNLEAIVANYPYSKSLPKEDVAKESQIRLALLDFLRGLVEFDPAKRWSPIQASKHPFVTGEPFTCPYKPPLETPRVPVSQNVRIDHHPGGGHWFAAGLSPNVPGNHRAVHNSPHFHMVPQAHPSSYGSLGSHSTYNDGSGFGNSYGSYGDHNNSNMFAYFSPVGPSGLNVRAHGGMSMIGSSSDARWRLYQHPYGNGLGVSPSAGNFAPLPLGTSPSQFTPPNSYSQFTPGSPGQYGPTSPARGSCHGSPLGKMAASSQLSRRKGVIYSGNVQFNDSAASSQRHGQFIEGTSCSQAEGSSQGLGGSLHLQSSPSAATWRQQRGSMKIAAVCPNTQNLPGSSTHGSNLHFAQVAGTANDKSEACQLLPDPGDWDPNYSDELLLEEDNSEASRLAAEFSARMYVNQNYVSTESVGAGKFNPATRTNPATSIQRSNGLVQALSHVEVSKPPSAYDMRGGYGRSMSKPSHFMPHLNQNTLSRLGQHTVPRSGPGRSTAVHGSEWNHMKVQPPPSSFFSGGPHSPGSSSLNNGVAWGGRANHPVAKLPPTSHGKKDCGRIA